MGVLNVTPDSFSDGGDFIGVEAAMDQVARMVDEGADIIDVGGESTRPGAEPVDGNEERQRVLPIIEAIHKRFDCLISIDTYRAETASAAVAAGAHIVNDVWGLQKEPAIAKVAADTRAGLVIMHTGRGREKLTDVIEDQNHFLRKSLQIADENRVSPDTILLDPGFGFAKDTDENLDLMARLTELHQLGHPLLIGTSRKRFLGAVSGHEVAIDRDVITAASGALARMAGGHVFRVHNVRAQKDALSLCDAIVQKQYHL